MAKLEQAPNSNTQNNAGSTTQRTTSTAVNTITAGQRTDDILSTAQVPNAVQLSPEDQKKIDNLIIEQQQRVKNLEIAMNGIERNLSQPAPVWRFGLYNALSLGSIHTTYRKEREIDQMRLASLREQKSELENGFLKQAAELKKTGDTTGLVELYNKYADTKIEFHTKDIIGANGKVIKGTETLQKELNQSYEDIQGYLNATETGLEITDTVLDVVAIIASGGTAGIFKAGVKMAVKEGTKQGLKQTFKTASIRAAKQFGYGTAINTIRGVGNDVVYNMSDRGIKPDKEISFKTAGNTFLEKAALSTSVVVSDAGVGLVGLLGKIKMIGTAVKSSKALRFLLGTGKFGVDVIAGDVGESSMRKLTGTEEQIDPLRAPKMLISIPGLIKQGYESFYTHNIEHKIIECGDQSRALIMQGDNIVGVMQHTFIDGEDKGKKEVTVNIVDSISFLDKKNIMHIIDESRTFEIIVPNDFALYIKRFDGNLHNIECNILNISERDKLLAGNFKNFNGIGASDVDKVAEIDKTIKDFKFGNEWVPLE